MAMLYTEFACISGGSNLNAGTRKGDSTVPDVNASFTYTSGTFTQGTRTFTVLSGNPSGDGVVSGDFASVVAATGTAPVVTNYVARIDSVTASSIIFNANALAGTLPTDGSTTTLRVGGAWAGPSGTGQFPFSFISPALQTASGYLPRVNFKNDKVYSVTAAMTHSLASCSFEGFTSSYGDNGYTVIDGGTGASYVLLTVSGSLNKFKNFDFKQDASSSASVLVNVSASFNTFANCSFHDCRSTCLRFSQQCCYAIECEAYNFNKGNTAGAAAFSNTVGIGCVFDSCFAHHGYVAGFIGTANQNPVMFLNCIAANIYSGYGFGVNEGQTSIINCDAYACSGHGIWINCTSGHNGPIVIKNCNLTKNTGYGIYRQVSAGAINPMILRNCAFGSGTEANGSGTYINSTYEDIDMLVYPVNSSPYANPTNGNFQVTLDAAKNVGRGYFMVTDSGHYSATTSGCQDIGAAPHRADGGIVPSQVQVT